MLGGGLWTMESILVGIVYGEEAEHLYRIYLCVGDGERITPAKFSMNIQQWNFDYFGCRWGLRDFRQGSYAEADSILAESADHSAGIDVTHYAGVHGTVPQLSNNTICHQRWLGDEWHSFLSLGPFLPQELARQFTNIHPSTPIRPSKGKARADNIVPTSDQSEFAPKLNALKGKVRADDVREDRSSSISLFSLPTVACIAYRKCCLLSEPDEDEDKDEDEEPSRRLKHLQLPPNTVVMTEMEVISISSDDDMSSFIVPDSSQPSIPPPAVEQMVPQVLDNEAKCLVVCPFSALLDEQYAKMAATGLCCHDYCKSKEVADNVQVLFIQVEHCSTLIFTSFLMSPLGKKFSQVFIDEFHDMLNCHPGHTKKWKALSQQFVKMEIQVILLTTMMPPHQLISYLKPFGIKKDAILTVRYMTNRPEIGMHVVHVEPVAAKQSLAHIIHALKTLLKDEERILVFFGMNCDVDEFGMETKFAVYHSELWEAGNTKAYNLNFWDRGESKVMACTMAFTQGIDRSNVRFVVIFRPVYGLLVNNQMLGRVHRDGLESHVFFVTDQNGIPSFSGRKQCQDQCVKELSEMVSGNSWRRYANMVCMDGENLATRCTEEPHGVPCNVCNPNSPMQQLVMEAIENPMRPLHGKAAPPVTVIPGSGGTRSVKKPSPAFVPASFIGPEPAQPLSQESDDVYRYGLHITLSQARILDTIETINQPSHASGSKMKEYKSSSQPSAHITPMVESPPPPPPSMHPSSSLSYSARADRVNQALRSRLARTSRLSRYMQVLKDRCPIHFASKVQLVTESSHSFKACDAAPMGDYNTFKRSFTFTPYTYCFQCCLPQSRNHNGEEPACHSSFSFQKGVRCPFDTFIFKAVFCIWQKEEFRHLVTRDLAPDRMFKRLEEFSAWAVLEEAEEGKYNNCVEVFLWFCREIEREKPQFFL
ncbi:hypothetical protein DFH29DRAFT_879996 [Suillus ampliporus]|nr:hypothetical protein DFH29DRAFT_879996 [Suillus ampliporus]